MIKISEALIKSIENNPLLEFGFSYKLFNLSQLARFLKNDLERQTKKEVQEQAIIMNLSRLQRNFIRKNMPERQYYIDKISVSSNLATITIRKNNKNHQLLQQLHQKAALEQKYFIISESSYELTVFFEKCFFEEIMELIYNKYIYINENISSISLTLSPEMCATVGTLDAIMQKLTFNNIDIIEVSSTWTEFTIYIDNKNIEESFQILHSTFIKK